MKNVSKAKFESMLIPKVAQRAFAKAADCVRAQPIVAQRASSAYEDLFGSLQSCAFRGEL